jgi:hypothetical protein
VPGALQRPTRSARLPSNRARGGARLETASWVLPAFHMTLTTGTAWSPRHVDGANADLQVKKALQMGNPTQHGP